MLFLRLLVHGVAVLVKFGQVNHLWSASDRLKEAHSATREKGSIMSSTSNVVNVSPSPGFCIKSKLLQPGILNVISSYEPAGAPVPVPQGRKVFVNIAWSKDVPPPLGGIEKVIEFATRRRQTHLKNETDTPISVFASSGRLDTDKGMGITRICCASRCTT